MARCFSLFFGRLTVALGAARPRLAVLADIGGDPDDQQSLVRLMVYANDFDLELLLASAAVTPGELKHRITRPDLIREIVDAYGQVLPNLSRHASGWPTTDELRARIVSGNPHRGRDYIGAAHDPADPAKPHWGGQHALAPDGWYRDLPARPDFDPRTTVSRWHPDF